MPRTIACCFLATAFALPAQGLDMRKIPRHWLPELAGVTRAVTAGDLNRDSRPDLLLSKGGGPNVILLGCPNGGFLPIRERTTDSGGLTDYDAALVDIDGDGDLDALTAGWEAGSCDQNRVLVNDGSGNLTDETRVRLMPTSCCQALAAADFDGDSDVDLFVGGFAGPHRLYLNDGRGYFTEASGRLPTFPDSVVDAAAFDADGDGDVDLVVAQSQYPSQLLINDGRGRFAVQPPACFSADFLPASAVAVGDLDGDSDPDLVYAGVQSGLAPRISRLMINDGRGCFELRPLATPYNTRSVCVGDFDGDRDLDICFGYTKNETGAAPVTILTNDGAAGFTEASWDAPMLATMTVACADVDSDGDADLWIGAADSEEWYASFANQLDAPAGPRRGTTYVLTITHRYGQAVPATAVLFASRAFLTPNLPLPPYGVLGLSPASLQTTAPLPLPASGELELRLAIPQLRETLAFQALIVPADPRLARFTNVVGEWFE